MYLGGMPDLDALGAGVVLRQAPAAGEAPWPTAPCLPGPPAANGQPADLDEGGVQDPEGLVTP